MKHLKFILGIFATLAIVLGVVAFTTDVSIESLLSIGGLTGGVSLAGLPIFIVEGEFKALEGDDWDSFVDEADANELAGYYKAQNEAKEAALKKMIDEKATPEDIEALKAEIVENQTKQFNKLNEALAKQGLAITKLLKSEKVESKNFVDSLKAKLTEHLEVLKEMKAEQDEEGVSEGAKRIRFKVAGDMTITGNVTGGVPLEQRLDGLDVVPSRRIRLMDLVSRGTALSNVISWVSQANKDGSAGGTAEGAAKNKLDFDLVVDSENVKKRTAFIKVSTEMLDDIPFMASEINNELFREVGKDVENQVYQGDDTGTNLNGIRTVSPAFAAGTFANTVDNANKVDVLRVAKNQIAIAEQEEPNGILMHPSDLTSLLLEKVATADKRYLQALQEIASSRTLDGVPIVTTTLVTVDDYLIGDFTQATVWDKGDVSIEIGLDGNDFTNNFRTVIAEWRGLVIVRTNRRSSFVAGDFSTNAAALETP